ncbi:transglutaminase-like domain-containing protein [Protaetiibacter larvae]|uniref:Transglutaminase domain-containing protein n=1 Tax=Protaetiibacter larvae TaxID=2592654 RepID=A0A5C1Y8S2_9MICO|nr:transglutaminase-like domain-containing protein [Protaetiibacter larvae]QEO10301.1 transglutaminase domain-containing protein [Protaetiibacter larvae]
MDTVARSRRHTAYSDPGEFRERWRAVPRGADPARIGEVVRNLLYHYRADGIEVPAARRGDIDSRWVARILELDAQRHEAPLDAPRAREDRVAGCCRDFTLLTVSALREQGVAARSRVGFAGYLREGYHFDHVIVEFWDGARWVRGDAQLDPTWFAFPTWDLVRGEVDGFLTAAEVWQLIRAGGADPRSFGVFPTSPLAGTSFVFDYVIRDIAHRFGEELLLWDVWGGMVGEQDPTPEQAAWMDALAALVVAADADDADAEEALAACFHADDRLHPRGHVRQFSPYELPPVEVDLVTAAPGRP